MTDRLREGSPARTGAPQASRRRWIPRLLATGFWILPALLFTAQFYASLSSENADASWGRILAFQVIHWGLWAGWTPLVRWWARRVPLERDAPSPARLPLVSGNPAPRGTRWGRWTVTHLATSLVVGCGHLALSALALLAIQPFPSEARTFGAVYGGLLRSLLLIDVIIYGVVLGVGYAADYYRKYHAADRRRADLEAQLARAQLQALKMQLHPHFLFNTLNAIASLVRTGKTLEATDMIAGLSELLRLTLESAGTQEVSLRHEIDLLERYLAIEQIRFGDRLRVRIDLAPETLAALVPNLILQPLVENAVRHGIAQRAAAGLIEIHARRHYGLLRLQVRDDGPGLPDEDGLQDGLGLATTRARLERLYGASHRLELSTDAAGGTRVVLDIPFHAHGPDTDAHRG